MISLIAAVSENGVIGRDNQLPWRLSSDLQRFKVLTMGHHLIVGRKTFLSIGQPLPGRHMIVLTRDAAYRPSGVQVAGSLPEALDLISGDEKAFIGGGSELFKEALEQVDRLYLTIVHAVVKGDSFFPEIDSTKWEIRSNEAHPADQKNEYSSTFQVLDRVSAEGRRGRLAPAPGVLDKDG